MTLLLLTLALYQPAEAVIPTKDELVDGVVAWMQQYRELPNLAISFRMEYTPVKGPVTYAFSVSETKTLRQGEKLSTVATLTQLEKGGIDTRQTTWDGATVMVQTLSKQVSSDLAISAGPPHVWTLAYREFDNFIFSPEGMARHKATTLSQPVADSDYWLPFALERLRAEFAFAGEDVLVDGRKCFIIARGDIDKMWVSPEIGYAICRREVRRKTGESLMERTDLSDFREVDRMWLPFRVVREEYGLPTAPPDLRGQLVGKKVLTVKAIDTSRIDDSQFALEITPGTRVIDNIRQITYTRLATGEDVIEEAVKRLQDRGPTRYVLISVNIVVVIIIAILFWYRRRRGIRGT